MATDLSDIQFTQSTYSKYIYGSAEVVGLMCLRVFMNGDDVDYRGAEPAAKALGSAYQKINFLRDFASDYRQLGRVYFPGVSYNTFSDVEKQSIIDDINRDLAVALPGIATLPLTARYAVRASYDYYSELLNKLKDTPAETIKQKRIRLPNLRKLYLLAKVRLHR